MKRKSVSTSDVEKPESIIMHRKKSIRNVFAQIKKKFEQKTFFSLIEGITATYNKTANITFSFFDFYCNNPVSIEGQDQSICVKLAAEKEHLSQAWTVQNDVIFFFLLCDFKSQKYKNIILVNALWTNVNMTLTSERWVLGVVAASQ